MTPPQRLRHDLERQRDKGRTFRQAWPVAQAAALADASFSEAVWWRRVWSEQRTVWALAYSRMPWPAVAPALEPWQDSGAEPVRDLVVA